MQNNSTSRKTNSSFRHSILFSAFEVLRLCAIWIMTLTLTHPVTANIPARKKQRSIKSYLWSISLYVSSDVSCWFQHQQHSSRHQPAFVSYPDTLPLHESPLLGHYHIQRYLFSLVKAMKMHKYIDLQLWMKGWTERQSINCTYSCQKLNVK